MADLDGDGDLDVVTANSASDNISFLAGDGSGELTAESVHGTVVGPGGDGPRAIDIADVTNDGTLDVVTANTSSDDVAVFEGLGDGRFAPVEVYTTRVGAGGDGPEALVLSDVTGDSIPDVITANAISDDVTVLVADGVGGLHAPIRISTLVGEAGDAPSGVTVADVTEDGQPDVITANSGSHDVTILPGVSGGATFEDPIHLTISDGEAGRGPRGVQVADLDGDGHLDILTSNTTSDDVSVLLGTGGGAFDAARVFESRTGYSGDDPRAFGIADVNGDGALDVVAANDDSSNITVLAGFGDGLLTDSQTVYVNDRPYAAAAGDFDGDGAMDWLMGSYGTGYVYRGLRRESGEYSTSRIYPFDGGYGDDPYGLAVGDVDGDDDLDFATAAWWDDGSVVMRNNGSGSFSTIDFYGMGLDTAGVTLADVTGDDALDLITVGPSADRVYVRPGTGSGSFSSTTTLETSVSTSGRGPIWVTVADVNDDLFPDILTANRNSNDVTLLLGMGSGSFAEPLIVPATFAAEAAEVTCVRVGHFNDDDILDIATANSARDSVSVILGFGDADYAAPQSYDVGFSPYAIAVDDFDDDGVDDIASVDYGDHTVTVLLGLGHR